MTLFCSHCGVPVTDNARFCFKCGAAINVGDSTSQNAVQANLAPKDLPSSTLPERPPGATAEISGASVDSPTDQIRKIQARRIGTSKGWPIFATFAFFLCAAIIQSKSQHADSPPGERFAIIISVMLFYTAIGAIYFWRSKASPLLTPWEVESRGFSNNRNLFVAATLSSALQFVYLFTSGEKLYSLAMVITLVFIAAIFALGYASLRDKSWAFVTLFLWEIASAIFGGSLDPFGLFIVVFSVQAFRYHKTAEEFAKMNAPNLLGDLTGFTKLAYAAAVSQKYYAKRLVKSGANVNERTATGFTPLMIAAATNKSPSVVKYLLQAGADAKMRAPDDRLAKDFARERGASNIASLLAD